MNIKSNLQAIDLRKAYEYIDRDPQENFPKIIEILDTVVPSGIIDSQLDAIRNAVSDLKNNWYKYIMGIWTDIDDGIRRSILKNFVINATIN